MENFNIDDYIDERNTIYTTEDPLTGHIEVCEGYYDGGYMRFLLVDDAMQSAVFLDPDMEHELPFDYMESFNFIFTINKNIKRTLLIGGGGFAYPKYYLDMYPDKYIDAIEISKPVVDTARAYFGLDELQEKNGEHLKVIIDDGNKYLIDLALRIREAETEVDSSVVNSASVPDKDSKTVESVNSELERDEDSINAGSVKSERDEDSFNAGSVKSERDEDSFNAESVKSEQDKDSITAVSAKSAESDLKYDVIINDAYVGHKSSDLLKKSAELIKSCLKKDGIYIANMVIPLKGEGAKRSQKDMDVFAEVFNYTFLLQCDEEIHPYVRIHMTTEPNMSETLFDSLLYNLLCRVATIAKCSMCMIICLYLH